MGKPEITIGVTGLNAIDSPGPGVGVIRSIREYPGFDCRIIGLSYESLEPGIYMHDIVDKSYQIPYPQAGSERLLNRLQAIHTREKLDVIIPNFDSELHHFIRLAANLEKWGVHTFLPTLQQLERLDKLHLHEFGEAHGFKVPQTALISSKSEIPELSEEFEWPMVIKGKFYEAYVAYNEGQIQSYFDKLSAKWGLPVIIQEFVRGTELDIAGLGDGTGSLIGAVPMRKLYITDKGKGWSGVVLDDEQLIQMTSKFVRASKWKGGFELEIMLNDQEEFFLMEVNPRFPAWIYMAAAAGQNLPGALVELALGKGVKPFSNYEAGKMFVRYSWDLITDISEFEKISTLGEL